MCGDVQGQDDSGRSSHSESMVSETTYSVGHEYKVLESSECTVRDCETFVVERVEPYRVNATVNGEIVNFIVDTGSELTLMPEKVFTQLRIRSTMKPTLVKLKAYNGSQVIVLGETEMNLKLCESCREFRINVVVREGSCPILGRDVLSLAGFNFKSVFELEKCDKNVTSACQFEVPRHYQKVFDTGSFEPISKYSASLYVNEAVKPIKYPARKASYHMEPLIAAELNRLESEGIIESVNAADVAWLTPIIAVRKANNKIRICGSYDLTLDPHIESDFYKIPDANDIFHKISGCQFFSKIDMYQAFFNIPFNDADKKLTAINTPCGVYLFNVLPYGIKSSPGIFNDFVQNTLIKDLVTVHAFYDDVIITSSSREEHIKDLHTFSSRCLDYNVTLNKDKCAFFRREIEFLGNVISSCGIKPSESKVEAICKAKKPSNVTELRSFFRITKFSFTFCSQVKYCFKTLTLFVTRRYCFYLG